MLAWGATALAAVAATAPKKVPASAAEARGTYRMRGTAHVAASPVIDRDVEVHADAVLDAGRGPREVRAHLVAEGAACDLVARLGGGGELSFEPGQTCHVPVDAPAVRGRVEARLRSGRGRVAGETLSLELAWDLDGAVTPPLGRAARALGIPSGSGAEIPVRGQARATAEGWRDNSRAANR